MKLSRRGFLKIAGLFGSGVVIGDKAVAAEKKIPVEDFCGMLVDTTLCIGCRACEEACNEANDLPAPEAASCGRAGIRIRSAVDSIIQV